jgi:ribosome-associated translation inhibitor RaiA
MLDITFRHLEGSESVRSLAEELLARLAKNHTAAMRCHLVIEQTSRAHVHSDAHFAAHLELSFGQAAMKFQAQSTHEDALTAVREVFAKVDTQVARHVGRRASTLRIAPVRVRG